MNNRDIFLMKYLSKFHTPVKIQEETAPEEMRNYFVFKGLDVSQDMNSIWVRLHNLKDEKIVRGSAQTWEITDFGREQYSQLYYQYMGQPIGAIVINTTIKEACEMIFKEHLDKGSVIWTKELFKLKHPINLNEAKEKMLHEEIIYKTNSNVQTTMIAHQYEDTKSYEEAKELLRQKKHPSVQNIQNIDKNYGIAAQDSELERLKVSVHLPTEHPIKNTPTNNQNSLWHIASKILTWILKHVLQILLALLIAYLIFRFGWS
jgi:hypothetical protein